MNFIRDKFKVVETDGDWALLFNYPVYKEIKSYGSSYIKNTKTGENCGQSVELCCNIFDDDGNYLEKPLFEDDCYIVVAGD